MNRSGLALLVALGGAVVGFFAFLWIARQGFYALVLPGALVGVAASFVPTRSVGVSFACGFIALATGLLAEWHFAPFIADGSLPYFFSHIHQLKPVTLIMIAAGAFIGFWGPYTRSRPSRL
jgi:hypothetical protein